MPWTLLMPGVYYCAPEPIVAAFDTVEAQTSPAAVDDTDADLIADRYGTEAQNENAAIHR